MRRNYKQTHDCIEQAERIKEVLSKTFSSDTRRSWRCCRTRAMPLRWRLSSASSCCWFPSRRQSRPPRRTPWYLLPQTEKVTKTSREHSCRRGLVISGGATECQGRKKPFLIQLCTSGMIL